MTKKGLCIYVAVELSTATEAFSMVAKQLLPSNLTLTWYVSSVFITFFLCAIFFYILLFCNTYAYTFYRIPIFYSVSQYLEYDE